MADKRICELVQATDINDAAFLACDDPVDGTKKLSIEQLTKEGEFVKEFKGENLAAIPTYKGSMLLKEMYGMSAQDGTPTPSVPIAIKSAKANFWNCGKNLLPYPYYQTSQTVANVTVTVNGDGSITLNGTASANNVVFRYTDNTNGVTIPLGNHKYIVSAGITRIPGLHFFDMSLIKSDGSTYSFPAVETDTEIDNTDGRYLGIKSTAIYCTQGTAFNNLKLKPMIRLKDASDEWEPYNGQSVNTNLTLRAIEVSSTDDYNLVKDGKYYIADTLEKTAEGYQIVRRIGEYIINGAEGWAYDANRFTEFGCSIPLSNYASKGFKNITTISGNVKDMVNDYLPCKGLNWTPIYPQDSDLGSGTYRTAANIWLTFGKSDMDSMGVTDYNSLLIWLSNHNIKVLYPTNEVVEPISQEDAYKLLSLRSYDEATYLAQTAETEGYVILEYGSSESATEALTGYVKAEKADNGDVVLFKEESIMDPGTYKGAAVLKKMYGMSVQDGTPTPSSPVDIENAAANFVETGKNIIPYPYYHQSGRESNGVIFTVNEDGSITANGSNTTASSSQFDLCDNIKNLLKPGQKYKLSSNGGIYGTCQVFMDYQTTSASWGTLVVSTESEVVFTMPDDFSTYAKFRIMISVSAGKSVSNLTLKPILTIYEANDTDYLPYEGNSITTGLTLRAIEVTANDAYNLVKGGKYYVADTLEKIDGGFQIVRRIGDVTLTGNTFSTWSVGSIVIDGTREIYKAEPTDLFGAATPRYVTIANNSSMLKSNAMASHFKNVALGQLEKGDASQAIGTMSLYYYNPDSKNYLAFRLSELSEQTSAAFNTWLSSNNVNIVYELATPTVEAVTDANALALLSLNSYDEATYIIQTATVEGVIEIEIPLTRAAGYATMGAVRSESNEIRIEALES